MWLRRGFYYAQFWAIPVLPLWLLIGRGIAIDGSGWELVFLLFAAPALSLALIVVMALTVARKSVRRSRVLSWVDVGILTVWYASIVVAGVFSSPLAAVAVVVFTLVAFWGVVWQLVVETRQRINLAFASYGAVPVTSR
ncbi:MAG: MFS transporter [Cryobacterium sp.]|jgi:ABC-type multidrug transport system permease subunit|nr:MFS transporter [Cryobacterium sp.]